MRFGVGRNLSTLARSGGVAIVVLLLSAARAAATPVTFDEAVSGDLSFALPMGSPFVFGAGANTISGTTVMSVDDSIPSDFDSFAFTIPGGMHLSSITLSLDTTADPRNGFTTLRYGLTNGNVFAFPGTFGDETFDMLAGSPGPVFEAAWLLGAGTYGMNWLAAQSNFGFSSNYTWTFTVDGPANTAVPEPASLLLFGTGLITAARRFRRRR